jgi:hypothetical protein
MYKKLKKTLQKNSYLLFYSALFSTAKLYGVDNGGGKRTPFQNFLPEPFFHLLGVVSVIIGVFKTWEQKNIRPLIFFGGVGVAILMIF